MAETQNRLARELETRAIQERPTQWMQPELLPEPDKQPGYNLSLIHISEPTRPY